MEILKRHKYLLAAIIATAALLYADFLTYGEFRISLITIFFGFVPLFILIVRYYDKSKPKSPGRSL